MFTQAAVPSAPGLPVPLDVTPFAITLRWDLPCDHGEAIVSNLLEMALVSEWKSAAESMDPALSTFDYSAESAGGAVAGDLGGALDIADTKPNKSKYAWVEVSRLLPTPTRYVQGLEPGGTYVFRARVRWCSDLYVCPHELLNRTTLHQLFGGLRRRETALDGDPFATPAIQSNSVPHLRCAPCRLCAWISKHVALNCGGCLPSRTGQIFVGMSRNIEIRRREPFRLPPVSADALTMDRDYNSIMFCVQLGMSC